MIDNPDRKMQQPCMYSWIPVTERLPEKNGRYLVCFQGRSIETHWFLNGKWGAGYVKPSLVTHWMPLPLPPKEETP